MDLLRRLWTYLNTDHGPKDRVAPEAGSLIDHAIEAGGTIETHDLDPRLDDLKAYEAAGLISVSIDRVGPWASCSALVTLTAKGRAKYLAAPQQSVTAG